MSEEQQRLLRTLTRVVSALREHGLRFALTGGCAVYARGGPASEHDVDVLIQKSDVGPALEILGEWGMTSQDPAEDWLVKAYDGDLLVDLIHRPNECPVDRELLDRADQVRVGPITAPVMSATYVAVDKLMVLGPHRCDMTELLLVTRALREQIDWQEVCEETEQSPYAEAFLLLAERLEIIGPENFSRRGRIDEELRAVTRGPAAGRPADARRTD